MKLPVLSLLGATLLTLAACGPTTSETSSTGDAGNPTATATPPADTASSSARMAGDSAAQPAAANPNGPTAPHSNDPEFMTSAAHSDQNEIQFSKLALTKGVSAQTKAFANQMITDHTKSSAMLMPIAQKAGVTLPTDMDAEHKALAPQMQQLTGQAFEAKYLQQMVMDHQKTANTLKAHQAMTKNADLQQWISTTLPVVEGHLGMAQKDENMKGMKM